MIKMVFVRLLNHLVLRRDAIVQRRLYRVLIRVLIMAAQCVEYVALVSPCFTYKAIEHSNSYCVYRYIARTKSYGVYSIKI